MCKIENPKLNPIPMQRQNGRIVMISTCPVCSSNKSSFKSMKKLEVRGLSGIISHISLIGQLFKGNLWWATWHDGFRSKRTVDGLTR